MEPYPCSKSPCIDEDVFGPTQSNGYWSATPYAGNPDYAWGVDFNDGYVYYDVKTFNGCVRAVRGGL